MTPPYLIRRRKRDNVVTEMAMLRAPAKGEPCPVCLRDYQQRAHMLGLSR